MDVHDVVVDVDGGGGGGASKRAGVGATRGGGGDVDDDDVVGVRDVRGGEGFTVERERGVVFRENARGW